MIDVDPLLMTVDVIGDSIVNHLVAVSKETLASSTSSSSLGGVPLHWASTSTPARARISSSTCWESMVSVAPVIIWGALSWASGPKELIKLISISFDGGSEGSKLRGECCNF